MGKPCPTCKSDRCGNHAACARKSDAKLSEGLKAIFTMYLDAAEKRVGRKLTRVEADAVLYQAERDIYEESQKPASGGTKGKP
jgi:hypothetical protein